METMGSRDGPPLLVCEASGQERQKGARVTDANVRTRSKEWGAAGGEKGGGRNRKTGSKNTVNRPPPSGEGSSPGARGSSARPSKRPSAGRCPPRCCGVASTAPPPSSSPSAEPTGRAPRCVRERSAHSRAAGPPRSGWGGRAARAAANSRTLGPLRTPVSRASGAGPGAGHCGKGADGSARADPPPAWGGGGGRVGRAV